MLFIVFCSCFQVFHNIIKAVNLLCIQKKKKREDLKHWSCFLQTGLSISPEDTGLQQAVQKASEAYKVQRQSKCFVLGKSLDKCAVGRKREIMRCRKCVDGSRTTVERWNLEPQVQLTL